MNNEIKYLVRRIVLWYYNFRYSAYYPVVMPAVMICAGALIFILVILPQMENWFSIRDEVTATQNKINTMRDNVRMLQNMNKTALDAEFIVSTKALPSDKDFMGILNAIGQAASASKISLHDYQFSLGTVAINKDGKKVSPVSAPIQVGLTLEGSVDEMSNFLYEIERKLPIAQVENVNYAKGKGQILLVFYMKPLPNLNISYTDPLPGMSQQERNLLNALRSWSGQ